MKSVTCVYLHGFLSSGASQKGEWFKQQVEQEKQLHKALLNGAVINSEEPDGCPVFQYWLTPTYPISSPKKTIEAVEELVTELLRKPNESIVLAGSSMGGFYAQYLGQKYGLPYIMINPALNPRPIFMNNLGDHTNPVTEEALTIDEGYIEQLESYIPKPFNLNIPALLLIEEGDDLIDIPFALACYQQELSKFRAVLYKGGNHRFRHLEEAWQEIKEFVQGIE